MKKIFTGISILLLSILMVGCGPEFKLDLTKAKENVNALKSKEFSPMEATYYLQESEYFGTLEDIYQLETVGITKENISTTNGQTHYSMAVAEDGTSYFIGLPADGKKEALETELDTYYQDVQDKLLKTEHEGYLIYLVSNNNDEALKIIKDKGYPVLFPALMTVTDEMLESTFGFTKEDVEEYLIETPMMITSSQGYMVVKPAEGKYETVRSGLDEYIKKQEELWNTYLPDQYELVKNRLVVEEGDYLIYIISEDNNSVLEAIKSAEVK